MENSAKVSDGNIAGPSPQRAFTLAQRAISEKNWQEASMCWAILRRAYPEQPAPWIQGAIADLKTGNVKRAEILLEHARSHFPDNLNVLLQSANAAMQRGSWSAAEDFLEQARKKFPTDEKVWIKSALCSEARGDITQALSYNLDARERFPGKPGPFIQYAELAMRAEQWDLALSRWEEFRQRFPGNPEGYQRAAEAAYRAGRPQEARELLLVHRYGREILDDSERLQDEVADRYLRNRLARLLELVWTKAIFNLRSEVHHNYLSYLWWILEPLLHMSVYYLVFGFLLQRGGANYPVFLLTGLVPGMWFNKAVGNASGSIIGGQQLMVSIGLPPVIFPLINLLQVTLKQLPVFVLLFGFLWLQGYTPGAHWWSLVPVITVEILLCMAAAFMVAGVVPFVRDLNYLVPTGLTFLMFCSGIFYDYRAIPERWQELFLLNPMAFLLKCYREILVDGTTPDLSVLGWWGIGCAFACLVMMLAFRWLRYVYPRILMN